MRSLRNYSKPLVLAAGLAGLLSLSALAQPMAGMDTAGHGPRALHHRGPFPGFGGPLPPYLHGLSLSEGQQDRVFEIMHGQMPQLRQYALSIHKSRDELRDLGLAGRYDEGRAKALAEALGRAHAGQALLQARIDREILAVLTPEQRQEIDAAKPADRLRRPAGRHPAP